MSPDERLRLFVAARVPEDRLHWVDERIRPFKEAWPTARWAPLENQHVTLKFLGTTESGLLGSVVDVLEHLSGSHSAATVSLTETGAFPSARRARVLWLGLEDSAGVLSGIAASLDRAFAALGYRVEKRAFVPHLTLARFKSPVAIQESQRVDARSLEPFDVSGITLFRSHLHPRGARYEALKELPLAQGSASEKGRANDVG